jgi:hypothetical protein
MDAIVAPAPSCSIATTRAFFVPVRIFGRAVGAVPEDSGRFADLDLAVFTWRERGAGLRLEHASAAPSPHINARFAKECQCILSKMMALWQGGLKC